MARAETKYSESAGKRLPLEWLEYLANGRSGPRRYVAVQTELYDTRLLVLNENHRVPLNSAVVDTVILASDAPTPDGISARYDLRVMCGVVLYGGS
jgi:hypothetical protein